MEPATHRDTAGPASVRSRILLPFSLALSFLLAAFIHNVSSTHSAQTAASVERQLLTIQSFLDKKLQDKFSEISALIGILSADKELREAWQNRDRNQLLALSQPYLDQLRDQLGITHFYFHDAQRINFLRAYDPKRHGDLVDRQILKKAEQTGAPVFGIELGKLGTMTLRVVHPWVIDGTLTGYIEMGQEFDTFVRDLHDLLGINFYVSIYKDFLDRASWEEGMRLLGRHQDWDRLTSSVIVSHTPQEIPPSFDHFLQKGQHPYMEMDQELFLDIEGKRHRIGVIPLFDSANREIGDLVILHDVTQQLAASRKTILRATAACLVVGVILFVLFWQILGKVDQELTRHRLDLEGIVGERTEELRQSNEELAQEIAERLRVEEQLQATQKSLKKAQKIARIGNWEWDLRTGGLTCSEEMLELLGLPGGFSPKGLSSISEQIHPDDRSLFEETIRNATARCQPFRVETRTAPPRGEDHILHQGQVSCEDGQAVRLFCTIQDITQRRQLEQNLQRSRNLESIGVLAGGIAHDFNNLLTALLINIYLAREELPPHHPGIRLLDLAESAGKRASHLTGQLLTFSKGGSPQRRPIPLGELVTDTSNFVLSGSSIACRVECPADLWNVAADRSQLEQVFQNLLLNAKDAMPGGGTITIRATNLVLARPHNLPLPDGPYVVIRVRDTGQGISEAVLPKIFDPYYSTKPKGAQKGIGLGLSICHSIISKHEGLITVESKVGQGTTFTIHLPAIEATSLPAEPPPEISRPLAARGICPRILVMDDEDLVLDAARKILLKLGYEVLVARNGEEAIAAYAKAMAEKAPVAVAILDLTIRGGLGGVETMQRLQEIDPRVRAVLASGYGDTEIIAQHGRYGFSAAMSKPYTVEKIRDLLAGLTPATTSG